MMLVAVCEALIVSDSKPVLCDGEAVQAVECQSISALEVAADLSNEDVEITGMVREVVTKLDGESLAIYSLKGKSSAELVLDVFIVPSLTISEATCDELDVNFGSMWAPTVLESALATTEEASRTEVISILSTTEEDSTMAAETGTDVDSILVT